jgi:cysteine synthase A
MEGIIKSVDLAIGRTEMVSLSRIVALYGAEGNIYAKMEYLNPGSSKKDRVAKAMINAAESDGSLKKGQPVIELTSGNTGTGLAIVCAARGYRFIACISEGNSPERAQMMRALGAEVVIVPQSPGSPKGQVSGEDLALVEAEVKRLTQELGAFRADQFNLPANIRAHQYTTAAEMIEQTGGDIDAFVDFAGSGGTFAGCAIALKEYNADIKCCLVEPDTAAYYMGKELTNRNHVIQGGGYSMELPFIDRKYIDRIITVTNEEATEFTRALARTEGAFCGFSSGANVAAAIKLLLGELKGKSIALLLNDSGLKYLSTDLYKTIA